MSIDKNFVDISSIFGEKGNRALVVLDEVQKVPAILDVVQDLIDRAKANFILNGFERAQTTQGSSNKPYSGPKPLRGI